MGDIDVQTSRSSPAAVWGVTVSAFFRPCVSVTGQVFLNAGRLPLFRGALNLQHPGQTLATLMDHALACLGFVVDYRREELVGGNGC